MLDFTFFGRCFEFFIGMGVAIFINKLKNYNFKLLTYFGVFSICIFVHLLSILKIGAGYGTDCTLGKIINTFLLPLFGIAPLFFGLMIEKTLISKLLESKLFQIFGKSSYVFYLIHMGIFVSVLNKINENYVFHFVALNIISIFLHHYLEVPLNNFIKNNVLKV